MAKLVPLSAGNAGAVENLLDDAFGTDRQRRTAYLLRAGAAYIPQLSFGLSHDNRLIGSIQCWPMRLSGDDGHDAAMILVGPVAVAPDMQGAGYGHRLMNAMLDAAMMAGNPPLMMIGDAQYYGRFGFGADETGGWRLPGPVDAHRLLLRNPGGHILPICGALGPDIAD